MGQIQNQGYKPEYLENKPSQVVSMTKVDLRAARFTDASGRVNILLALFFGVDKNTGEPHMVVMNPDKITELFTVPLPHIKKDLVRLFLADQQPPPELPEGKIGGFDLAEVAEAAG